MPVAIAHAGYSQSHGHTASPVTSSVYTSRYIYLLCRGRCVASSLGLAARLIAHLGGEEEHAGDNVHPVLLHERLLGFRDNGLASSVDNTRGSEGGAEAISMLLNIDRNGLQPAMVTLLQAPACEL